MGRQFSMIGWDELTSWPGDGTDAQGQQVSSAYTYMLSRLRAVEGSGLRLEVRATCTPGGVGHSWVKARWNIPNDGSASEVIDPQTSFRRVFIPARISDNPYLAGTSYERSLAALPETSRKAMLLGRWDVFEGAVFNEWDPRLHTCDPFDVPEGLEMWRGADDGYAAQAAVLWFLYDDIHDRIFVVNELYQRGLTPVELAEAVLEIDKQYGRSLDGVIDSAGFADIGMGVSSGGGSRGDVMNRFGCNWQPAVKGEGSRVAGKSQIHTRLAPKDDGWPGLVITRNCRNLIRTLPALCYSKRNPEDVDAEQETHLYDALRYGLSRKRYSYGTTPLLGL